VALRRPITERHEEVRVGEATYRPIRTNLAEADTFETATSMAWPCQEWWTIDLEVQLTAWRDVLLEITRS
jgi:hypothetical protein